MTLFDSQLSTFELFDHSRRRVILRSKITEGDAVSSNAHFKKSLCPHLEYQKQGDGKIKTRIYTIKK